MKTKKQLITKPALKHFSTVFNIPKGQLTKLGVFDPILNFDTRLFVDPLLLQKSASPIIKNSYQTYEKFFEGILVLLKSSKSEGDKCWNTAKKKVKFPEYKTTCIGYGNETTNGSGMGAELSDQVFRSAVEIINLGQTEPAIFLLLPLLEEGIGADRISDMTQDIIDESICEYTVEIMNQLGLTGNLTYESKNKTYNLLKNPFSNEPIKLLPKDILDDLPVANDVRDFIYKISSKNTKLREAINKHIGKIFETTNPKITQSEQKDLLLRTLKNKKEFFLEVVKALKDNEYQLESYDIEQDYKGLYRWLEDSDAFTNIEFAKETKICEDNLDALAQIVYSFILHFKWTIENHNLSQTFWTLINGQVRHVQEFYSQMLFTTICHSWITGQDSNVLVEYNQISRTVNFTISNKHNILVHVKHSNNNQLEASYSKILASKKITDKNYYVVINFNEGSKQFQTIRKFSSQSYPIIEIEAAYDDAKEAVKYENIDTATNLKYYNEKTKGGSLSHQAYKPLKEKVEELCRQELQKGRIASARQLCLVVSQLIEKSYQSLLKNFAPYQNRFSGNDWTQPTFYNWCNQVFKNYKSEF